MNIIVQHNSCFFIIQIPCVELVMTCVWCKLVWSCPRIMILISWTPFPRSSFLIVVLSKRSIYLTLVNPDVRPRSNVQVRMWRWRTVMMIAVAVILVFQVTQWKLECRLDVDFHISDLPHSRRRFLNSLAFLPLTEDPLILGPCVKQIRRGSPGEREREYSARADLCHVTWFPWK